MTGTKGAPTKSTLLTLVPFMVMTCCSGVNSYPLKIGSTVYWPFTRPDLLYNPLLLVVTIPVAPVVIMILAPAIALSFEPFRNPEIVPGLVTVKFSALLNPPDVKILISQIVASGNWGTGIATKVFSQW